MIKALAIKELRESAAIIGVAVLAMLYILSNLMNWRFIPWTNSHFASNSIPFVKANFITQFLFASAPFAILLGLKQSAWEQVDNRNYFLLHRPLTRKRMLQTKIAVGLSLLLLLMVIPIFIYGIWAATPGNHSTPFFWGMTVIAWRACLVIPTIYLGAFLSGLRPARWIGTRLFPLLGASIFALYASILWDTLDWWLSLTAFAAIDLVLLALIISTANQRDY